MYLNLIQIAESFGVPEKVVEGWMRNDGLPYMRDRGILLFDRAQTAEWAAAHGLVAKAGFLAPDARTMASGVQIGPLLRLGGIWRDIAVADLPDVFARIAGDLPGLTPPVREMLAKRYRSPDGVTMAPVGGGYALPHSRTSVTLGRDAGTVALILLREPLPPPDLCVDEIPIRRLLFFVAPSPRTHLDLVARLSRLLVFGTLRGVLDRNGSDEEILQSVDAADAAPQAHLKVENR